MKEKPYYAFLSARKKNGLNKKSPHQKQEFIHEENRKGVWVNFEK